MKSFQIDGQNLTLDRVARVVFEQIPVELAPAARARVAAAREVIATCLRAGKPVYGINTGFGKLSDIRIPPEHLDDLQENLVRSHACGVGDDLPAECVRAILLLKANTLAKGFSGVRPEIIETLLAFLNAGILPAIPEKGSVGASGDLAPLAHMALPLLAEGRVQFRGAVCDAADALEQAAIKPLRLLAKEGLALLNGTQFMTGVGAVTCDLAKRLVVTADVIGAMSAEALLCTPVAFDARIQTARGYHGQISSAARLRAMMQDSPIRESHRECNRVQDPYSVRCMPQVHGSIGETVQYVTGILETEMNAATDNPLIFVEQGEILSGGNFHGHPVASAMDFLSICAAQLANISERRIAFMMDPAMSNLPPFLTRDTGVNSGFMMAQVTAASLVSENKILSHPASVDSIPTSANKEDFVTMGAAAAVKARNAVENCLHVLAVELLCACQGLEFRAPLRPGPASRAVLQRVREDIPPLQADRVLAGDIRQAAALIREGRVLEPIRGFIETEL